MPEAMQLYFFYKYYTMQLITCTIAFGFGF